MDYGPRVRFQVLLVNCIGFVTAAFGSITVVHTDIWSSDTDIVRSQDQTDNRSNKITAIPVSYADVRNANLQNRKIFKYASLTSVSLVFYGLKRHFHLKQKNYLLIFGKLPTENENLLRFCRFLLYICERYDFYETFTKITMTNFGQSQGGLHYFRQRH